MTNTTRQTINAYMEFDPSFGDHNLKATVGFNGEIYRYLYFKAGRQDLMSQDVSSLNIATGEYTEVIDKVNNAVTYGFFGRVNYDYAGKYLIEVSGRYDGTSRFAKNHRWGFFPLLRSAGVFPKKNSSNLCIRYGATESSVPHMVCLATSR